MAFEIEVFSAGQSNGGGATIPAMARDAGCFDYRECLKAHNIDEQRELP